MSTSNRIIEKEILTDRLSLAKAAGDKVRREKKSVRRPDGSW